MASAGWSPGTLIEVSGAFWKTCTLHAGVKLGVFAALGDREMAAPEVAGALGGSERGIPMLLNALAAMGLLERHGGRFRNTPEARRFLCPDSPATVVPMILHHRNLVRGWARLDEAVLSGKPVQERSSHVSGEEERESFLMGMFASASQLAPQLLPSLDLSGRRRLLDLGGGPGAYAIHFCLASPELQAVVFDLPTTRPFAERTIARFGLGDRITFQAGDFVEERAEGRFDAAWLSHVLHGEGPENCRKMLARAAETLEPGGLLLVHEFVLDDSMDSPLFPALFSLNMLVGTEEGRAYSEGQLRSMMEEAGAKEIRRLPFRGPTDSAILAGTM